MQPFSTYSLLYFSNKKNEEPITAPKNWGTSFRSNIFATNSRFNPKKTSGEQQNFDITKHRLFYSPQEKYPSNHSKYTPISHKEQATSRPPEVKAPFILRNLRNSCSPSSIPPHKNRPPSKKNCSGHFRSNSRE